MEATDRPGTEGVHPEVLEDAVPTGVPTKGSLDVPPDDTPWKRADVEQPIYDGLGERYLLVWCTRTATYDLGCIDGAWESAGEAMKLSRGELWRWLDVNPERHLASPHSEQMSRKPS